MELGGNLSTADENGSADLHRFFDYIVPHDTLGFLGLFGQMKIYFSVVFFCR